MKQTMRLLAVLLVFASVVQAEEVPPNAFLLARQAAEQSGGASSAASSEEDSKLWLRYAGKAGKPGSGKRIVLIAAELEYRSEETMPMLARLLSERHGFDCTVLFSINPETGFYDPSVLDNIPGLHFLKDADLLLLSVRFLELAGEQQRMMTDYFHSGRPIIGIRTTTHGFRGEMKSYGSGVFGNWSGHHGHHGVQGTRGVLNEEHRSHPVLTGVKDLYGPADVYGASPKMIEEIEATPLVFGQVLESLDPASAPVRGEKDKRGNVRNDPMMPVVWVRRHVWPSGVNSQILTSTMGSSQCFVHEGLRRLMVNACYWMTGLGDAITGDLDCDLVGEYKPSRFKGRQTTEQWSEFALTPEKLR